MNDEKLSIIRILAFASFAGIGGLLSYLLRSLNREERPRFSKGLVETLSSAFVGIVAMSMCNAMNIDIWWSGAIIGVFGWLGAETSIMFISNILRKRFGIDENVNNKNP